MAQASAKILEHTGSAEKKRVASMPQRKQWECTPEPSVQSTRSKENSSKGKKTRRVFLCRKTVTVKVKSKAILTSFPKIQKRETFVGAKDRKKWDG